MQLRVILLTRPGGKGMLQSKKTGVVNFSGNAITLDGFNIQFKGSKIKKKDRR